MPELGVSDAGECACETHICQGFHLTRLLTHTVKWIEAETAKHAGFLSIMSIVNLKVHTDRYNEMIGGVLFPVSAAVQPATGNSGSGKDEMMDDDSGEEV